MWKGLTTATALVLVVAACRSAGHDGAATACSPSGTTLAIAARNMRFDKQCLAAPAGKQFVITFDNNETIGHNLAILEKPTAADVLFRSTIAAGPRRFKLDVGPLRAGTYSFRCEVHPEMRGVFVVK